MPFALSDSVHSTGRKKLGKKSFTLKDCRNNVNSSITNNVKYIGKTKKKSKTISLQDRVTLDKSTQFL